MTTLEERGIECFHPPMQALSDDQHIAAVEAKVDKLEKKVDEGFRKVDEGFVEMRAEFKAVCSEARADFRLLLGILRPMYLTLILGLAALLLQHHV